jgi:hypothetical protein
VCAHLDRRGVRLIKMAVVAQDYNIAIQIKSDRSKAALTWGIPSGIGSENTKVDLYININALCKFLL